MVKNFRTFCSLLHNHKSFLANFLYKLVTVNVSSWNEGKYVKLQTFFTLIISYRRCIVDSIVQAVNVGNCSCVCAAFLDVRKSFHSIDRCILLGHLQKLAITVVELKWFADYLSNCMHYYATCEME